MFCATLDSSILNIKIFKGLRAYSSCSVLLGGLASI
jgi:hypothetical protein